MVINIGQSFKGLKGNMDKGSSLSPHPEGCLLWKGTEIDNGFQFVYFYCIRSLTQILQF